MSKAKRIIRSFPTDFLSEVIGTGKSSPHDGELFDEVDEATAAEIATYKGAYSVSDEETGPSRWANNYANVFVLPDGSSWETYYRRGTGDDGERPYEHDGARANCIQVEAHEVMVTKWRAVKADEVTP